MNVAAGLTSDGRYVAIASGWTLKPDPATDIHKGTVYGRPLSPICAISADSGRTWKQHPEIPMPDNVFVPFGRIAPLSDGVIGAMFYGVGVSFYTSSDHGATWTSRGNLTSQKPADFRSSKNTETTWIALKNGDLYAASRTRGDGERLAGYRSNNQGATWTFEEHLSLPGQAPADLTELPDGRILLTYGLRNAGGYGIGVRFADPAAKRWSDPLILLELEATNRDLGYPSTVVTKEQTLVTAYYTKGVVAHNRYHMGIVRWKPPGQKIAK